MDEINDTVETPITESDSTPDESLNEAYESIMSDYTSSEEEPVNEPDPVTQPKVDNAEASRLGRKVKELNDRMERMVTKDDLEAFANRLQSMVGKKEEPEEEDTEEITTIEDMKKFVKKTIGKELSKKVEVKPEPKIDKPSYEDTYLATMKPYLMTISDEATRKEVFGLLMSQSSPYNKRYSDNATTDCGKNFIGALQQVMRKPKIPPTQVSGTQSAPNKTFQKIDLDEDAESLRRWTGMNDEDVHAALSRDSKLSLQPKENRTRR